FLRAFGEAVLKLLMEADVEGLMGAGRYERNGERTTWRNGHRDRVLDTRLGSLQLRIPKLRQGSYFPPFLEARKASEKALIAVIQEAWIGGVSTRRVDELVQAMGLAGISKSQVSKLCKEIEERVHAFLDRPLARDWPYLWLDAGKRRLTRSLHSVRGSSFGRARLGAMVELSECVHTKGLASARIGVIRSAHVLSMWCRTAAPLPPYCCARAIARAARSESGRSPI